MRIWHWKSHWKLQPHWNICETTLKIIPKGNHTEISSLTTLKLCHLLLFKNVKSLNTPHCKIFSVTHIFCSLYFQRYSGFFSVWFSMSYSLTSSWDSIWYFSNDKSDTQRCPSLHQSATHSSSVCSVLLPLYKKPFHRNL